MGKGIYSRGFLPHWDFDKSLQAITFRLADSVPVKVIERWKVELASIPDEKIRSKRLHAMISKYEDAGHGSAVLKRPEIAMIVQEKLIEGHGKRYELIEWCVMPNHVHVLAKLAEGMELAEILRIWKGGSAHEINRELGRTGRLWEREYFDRYIRDMDHFYDCAAYIRNNPVKAGLCSRAEEWEFSSAGCGWDRRTEDKGCG